MHLVLALLFHEFSLSSFHPVRLLSGLPTMTLWRFISASFAAVY
jgi:hypothetical protein